MNKIVILIGVIGGYITYLFGGWDAALTILVVFMVLDFLTGITVAAVFKTSVKSQSGLLSSKASFKGLCKKGVILVIVIVACQLDILIKSTIIRDITIITFCMNEVISITENAGMMGVPIPQVIVKAIEVLKSRDKIIAENAIEANKNDQDKN